MKPRDGSAPLGTGRAFLIWGAVVIASVLVTVGAFAAEQFAILLVCWPCYHAAMWLGVEKGRATTTKLLFALIFIPLILLVYYAILHVGLLLAMWKRQARWLLLEAAMLAAIAGIFLLRIEELAKFLE